MTVDDILMLARRGFTAEQIAALAAVPTTQAAPAPEPDPAPVQPAAPAQPAPAPQPVQPQPAAPDQTGEILRKLGVLTDAIQASAILQSQQPKQETADDILAAIIAPPIIKKE
jgi:hypothetical protein